MGMKERNYWIECAKQKVLSDTKKADSYVSELMFLYDEAAYSIESEIHALYGKFAKDNELTDAEASKLLTSEEYSKWKKSIDNYLENVPKGVKGSKVNLELNTLAMKSRISRKEQLLTNVYENMMDLAGETETKVLELLGDIVKTNYYKGSFNLQKGAGLAFNVAKINDKKLKSVLEYPWSGKNFSQALWENTDKLAALARKEITYGFITGSSIPKMTKAINDVMGKGKHAAERLVRTETSYFSNHAEKMAYEEHDIIKYEFIGGGCEDCQLLNRKVFLVSEAEVGLNYPPIHPNCKCTTKASFEIDLFKKRNGANPLDDNVKFQEWKKHYVKDGGLSAHEKVADVPDHEEKQLLEKIDFTNKKVVEKKLRNYSDVIVNDNEKENAIVITPKGNIYHCFGTKANVYPNSDLGEELFNAYVTHNHPKDETEYSFSTDDISLFMNYRLTKLVGIDPTYEYTVERTKGTIFMDSDTITHKCNQYYPALLEKGMYGEIDLTTEEKHEKVKMLAKECHFKYKRRLR